MSVITITPPALNEQREFEDAMRLLGKTEVELQRKAEQHELNENYSQSYFDLEVESHWQLWKVQAKLTATRASGWVAALQELCHCDGTPANVRDAEILATRVRRFAATALRTDTVLEARQTAAMAFAHAMNQACRLDGEEMRQAVTKANADARAAGIDPAKVGLN